MQGHADQRAARPTGLAGGLADGNGGLACDEGLQRGGQHRCEPQDSEAGRLVEGTDPTGTGPTDSVWRDADWLLCRDGAGDPLNPEHSRWLMGYPVAWGSCGATAMQSCRRSRRSS